MYRPNPLFVFVNILLALSLVAGLAGCSAFKKVHREVATPESFLKSQGNDIEQLRKSSPFLKVHMRDGSTYVLQDWSLDDELQNVLGRGTLYNVNRDSLREGRFQVGLDSVAILETNVLKTSGAVAALTIFTGITAAVTINCIANPKACFGSCPTFYVSDGDSLRLKAEGFSASIAPSLEATDVDALFRSSAAGEDFDVEMRNEALETHVVRHVDLLAVPRARGCRVFSDTDGRFWECASTVPPVSAQAPEGDCLDLLSDADDDERYSKADSTYLGAKEIIELQFENVPGQSCGLVIGCRQTLLSTYLLYQTYAYMGNRAGYWMAQIERKNVKQHRDPIQNVMGGIEVSVQDSVGDWRVADRVDEYGPLATDYHLVPLGRLAGRTAKIRLTMTRGNWRIDYVRLAALSRTVDAVRVHPRQVLKDGLDDERAIAILCDSAQALTTFPGDTYTLRYHVPDAPGDYELFLESRGYYLEWIRKEWIEEENSSLLAQMFLDPQTALRRLAPEYKLVENEMENCFWRSRFAKQ